MQVFQTTLNQAARLEGIGVHSGKETVLTLRPAPENHGIVFARLDARGRQVRIPAFIANSRPADLCTVLTADEARAETRRNNKADERSETRRSSKADERAAPPSESLPERDKAQMKESAARSQGESLRVETIEHCMAALSACGVDNALAELSAAEMPILDGSALPFVKAIEQAGLRRQSAKRRYLRIMKTVRAEASGGAFAEFCPMGGAQLAQAYDVEIDFAAKAIGRQRLQFALTPAYFADNLARARTFGFLAQAEKLRSLGLAQGASEQNSVVIDAEGNVLNPQSLIAADGFVRHKALDAVGDTALLGRPFIGLFRSFKSGHSLNAAAVRAVLADKANYQETELPAAMTQPAGH